MTQPISTIDTKAVLRPIAKDNLPPQILPAYAHEQVIADWASRVRRCGNQCRAGDDLSIEAQSLYPPYRWHPIMLPGHTTQFATREDRDKVLLLLL